MTFKESIDFNDKMNRMFNAGFEAPPEVDPAAILRMVNDSPSSAIREQTEEIRDMHEQQLNEVIENTKKLQELCDIKFKELEEVKAEAKKAKWYNIVMLVATIVSTVFAVASGVLAFIAWFYPRG